MPDLNYQIQVRPVSFASSLPTLQSFAVGETSGQWVFISGRTNGLHGFDASQPGSNFPSQYENEDVWVVDYASGQSWHRSLTDPTSGLTATQVASLSPSNTEFYQSGTHLYMAGGYGTDAGGNYVTFDTLSSINLPGLANWVTTGTGSAVSNIRQIHDPTFQVTGGAMYVNNGKTNLVFGQDFEGAYTPTSSGTYTLKVRNFNVVDDGTNLSVANIGASAQSANYHRRDLNVFPTVRPNGGDVAEGLDALSGVFTPLNGAWTVPVEIDANGTPTMASASAPGTFKQGMNNYESAKVGIYSPSTGKMNEILFGGIGLQYFDAASNSIVTDNDLPFVNDISSVVIDSTGNYTQNYLGQMPGLYDLSNNLLRFGANAEFIPADGLPMYDNGVINLDLLKEPTIIGHIFGGIVANAPQTRVSPSTLSAASNQIFEVVLVPSITGDYNHNGVVDLADYVAWRDGLGTIYTQHDYDVWRARYGMISGSGAGAGASVPEPAIFSLVAFSALAGVTRRRRGMLAA
ncbi:MAG TPA: hypothetical protein VH107_05380 [Lacipirellulaceae bacterium]|nr:hypothetical protein [Lacipirellulaceae bacterium]